MRLVHGLLAFTLALALGACNEERPATNEELKSELGLLDQDSQFMATVQLQNPALLSSSQFDGARHLVDPQLRSAIVAEQRAFIQELRYMSPQVRVLHQYQMVLNGMTVLLPSKYRDRFDELTQSRGVSSFKPRLFGRPKVSRGDRLRAVWGDESSVAFIKAPEFHQRFQAKGEGIRVGVIDTGIDYTHSMFGGSGDVADYDSNDPTTVSDQAFPTAKVIGGYDFVGDDFDSSSEEWDIRLPKPDSDPLDLGGHGSHVAGTIAGKGDGEQTYDGVAPEASLFALKVFGTWGSTSDAVVIAALEYAADPNNDHNPEDKLDVVNLSLGSSFGAPNSLYDVAIRNLSLGRTVAVISAGNSGDVPYIVGSPSTAKEAISVAASVDAMDHNWKIPAIMAAGADQEPRKLPFREAAISVSVEGYDEPNELVYIGYANSPVDEPVKTQLQGKYALITRGLNPFCEKAQVAQNAGAAGFIVFNNVAGSPFGMGGDCFFDIPGVMVSKDDGEWLLSQIEAGGASVVLDSGVTIEFPEEVDKIASFSSRGPRSIDSLLKPEITAPGVSIISAAVGGGSRAAFMSGTSMSAPHIAGVAALLRQVKPLDTVQQTKARMMSQAKILNDESGFPYPLSRQGAGRVNVLKAGMSVLTAYPEAVTLGQINSSSKGWVNIAVRLQNHDDEDLSLNISPKAYTSDIAFDFPSEVRVPAFGGAWVRGRMKVRPSINDARVAEMHGLLVMSRGGESVLQVPVHGVRVKVANLVARKLHVESSPVDAAGAPAATRIQNESRHHGVALPFNILSKDERQPANGNSALRSFCDLESLGYRILEEWDGSGVKKYLDFAFKTYAPISDWSFCAPSLYIDVSGDGQAEFEMYGGAVSTDSMTMETIDESSAMLLDARKARAIRAAFDANYAPGKVLDYSNAVLDLQAFRVFNFSSISVLRLSLDGLGPEWRSLKVLGAVAGDFADDWGEIALDPFESSFFDFTRQMEVRSEDYEDLSLTKGEGEESLVLYYPHNSGSFSIKEKDKQSQVLKTRYRF